jgi:hypothetical protein
VPVFVRVLGLLCFWLQRDESGATQFPRPKLVLALPGKTSLYDLCVLKFFIIFYIFLLFIIYYYFFMFLTLLSYLYHLNCFKCFQLCCLMCMYLYHLILLVVFCTFWSCRAGNPVSALVCFQLLVEPAILRCPL